MVDLCIRTERKQVLMFLMFLKYYLCRENVGQIHCNVIWTGSIRACGLDAVSRCTICCRKRNRSNGMPTERLSGLSLTRILLGTSVHDMVTPYHFICI